MRMMIFRTSILLLANLLLEEYIDDYNTLPSYDNPSRSNELLLSKDRQKQKKQLREFKEKINTHILASNIALKKLH
tara:strand:- start:4191 stop:4418 length:228 start_codon:yes stop_codon:yes gene_type:complete